MPRTNLKDEVRRKGQHTRADINQVMREAKPRDNLREAFAGDQNLRSEKSGGNTHLKSRRTQASKLKTPKR